MNATALWDSVCKTDPAHVKEITGKQYKGNSPKPYYIVRRLTETFGPCGIGWGLIILNERMERLSETDMLHVAVVRLWYVHDGKRGEIEQIGQTKAAYAKAAGGMMVDEDAPKKSVTDALVKCASYLGFAGDIFAGRWDDSKYVAELRKEFGPQPTERHRAIEPVVEMIPKDELAELKELADVVKQEFADRVAAGLVLDFIKAQNLTQEQYVGLWSFLPSDIRAALKKESLRRDQPKAA
jgi:hypothetical protein